MYIRIKYLLAELNVCTCASLLDDSKQHLIAEVTAGRGHVAARLKVVGVVKTLRLRLCYVLTLLNRNTEEEEEKQIMIWQQKMVMREMYNTFTKMTRKMKS